MKTVDVDWDSVLLQTLYDVLGQPLQQDANNLRWGGKETARGEKSRSFSYALNGKSAGAWSDWSAEVGGNSVFEFFAHWNGWNKSEALRYLVSRGFIPARNNNEPGEYSKPQKTITYEWSTLDGEIVNQYRFEYEYGKEVRWQKGEKPPFGSLYYSKTLTEKSGTLLFVEGCKCAEIAHEATGWDVFTLINGTTRPDKTVLQSLIVKQNYDQVIFWPDNDRQGRRIVRDLAHTLKEMGIRQIRIVNSFLMQKQGDAIDDVEKAVATTLLSDAKPFIENLTENLADIERDTLQWKEAREVFIHEQSRKHSIVFVSSLGTSRGFDQALKQAGCELRYDVRKKDLVVRFGQVGGKKVRTHKHFANLSPRPMQPDGWRMRDESLMRAFQVFFDEYVATYAVDKKGRQIANLWKRFNKETFRTYGWNYVRDMYFHGDSFLDYLNSLPAWDGKKRLDFLLRDAMGVEYGVGRQIDYHKHCSRQPFVNAINRANNPGAKCDEVLTLVGPQGVGKSQVIAHLTPPEWQKFWVLGDYEPSAKTQDLITDAHPTVFIELAEVDQIAQYTSNNKLKRMLSRQFDVARLPWHETSERADRQFVCMATANDQGKGVLFDDASGNRRFLTVECHSTKDKAISYLNANRDQLWAEALVQYKEGVSTYLPDDLADVRDDQNESFVSENPLQRRIVDAWQNGIFEEEIQRNIERGEKEKYANHINIQRIAEIIQFAKPYPLETDSKQPNGQNGQHTEGFDEFEGDAEEVFGEFQILTRSEETEMGNALKKMEAKGWEKHRRSVMIKGVRDRYYGYFVPRIAHDTE